MVSTRSWTITATTPSADAGSIGYVGGLKYAFSSDSYARLQTALGSTTPQAATDAQVAAYADNYFEYDSAHPASKEIAQGEGCSSTATSYDADGNVLTTTDPDGTSRGINYVHQSGSRNQNEE